MTAFSSRRVYDVWTQVIQDEELYEAMLAGAHGQLAGRQLDAEAIAILDQFGPSPARGGTSRTCGFARRSRPATR